MRIVADTNTVLSGLLWLGPDRRATTAACPGPPSSGTSPRPKSVRRADIPSAQGRATRPAGGGGMTTGFQLGALLLAPLSDFARSMSGIMRSVMESFSLVTDPGSLTE